MKNENEMKVSFTVGQRATMGGYTAAKKSKQPKVPTPGPSHYSPKVELTKPSTPQYSIGGRPKQVEGTDHITI